MKKVFIGLLAATAVISLTGNVLLYLRYSSSRPLVRVGNEIIRRKDYQDAVDTATQGAILRKMVFAKLVTQGAAQAGVTPTEKEIDAQIAMLQRTKPEVLSEPSRDAEKMAVLRQNIKADLALENLRIQHITVTPAEVNTFYQHNKQSFLLPSEVQTTMIVSQNAVDASTAASLLQHGTPMDVIARQPRLHVVGLNGFSPNWSVLPPNVHDQLSTVILAMKPGDVRVMPVGQDYLTMRAAQSLSAGVPPLAQIRDQVARMAKLRKAPPIGNEMAHLYHSIPVEFEMDRYQSFFSDVQSNNSEASKKVAKKL